MTRRRIVFTDSSGRRYITPEYNGDKAEFERFRMSDIRKAIWEETLAMFSAVTTLEEFTAANYRAQENYKSSITPDAPPEPVIEINAGILIPDEFRNCDELIYLAERGAG